MPHLPPLSFRLVHVAVFAGLALALGLFVSACRVNGEPLVGGAPALPDMVLRAYDVPAANAQEVRNIVSSLLYRGEGQPRQGNVVVAPTGQLLVAAPASFHDGVAQLTSDLKKSPPPPPPAIAIDYWLVQAIPGSDGTSAVGEVPTEAVDAIRKLANNAPLTLWDHSRLFSIASERAQIERQGLEISQTASAQDTIIVSDIQIKSEVGNVQVRAALPLDKTIVLAQASSAARGSATANGAVFYVVRATLADRNAK